jgi:hypothetical protein
MNTPDGLNEIIVLTKLSGNYTWHISDKEFWVMDYRKYAHVYDPLNNDFSYRFDIAVLNEDSALDFFEKMRKFKVDQTELTQLIKDNLPLESWEENLGLFPVLFLDFDSKKMMSLYSELFQFEKFVPQDWHGEYEDFYGIIPEDKKYWVIEGVDHFRALE